MQILNELSYPFHLTYSLFLFFLIYFSVLNPFWFVFLQFLFIKGSNNFFTIKIIINIYQWNFTFNFFNDRNFFWSIWSAAFSKYFFLRFDILTLSPTFNLEFLSLTSLPKLIQVLYLILTDQLVFYDIYIVFIYYLI